MRSDWATIALALSLYAAVVVSPGLNFALITRLAIAGRRRAATGAIFGLAVAATLYAILTMTGLTLVVSRVHWLAGVIQVAGGGYLLYLGGKAWVEGGAEPAPEQAKGAPAGPLRGWRMGMIVNLSNPKAIVFFLSLYAVAVPPATALWAKLVILVGGFALEIAWYNLVAILFSTRPARAAFQRFGIWIERAIGTMLAGFGLRLIWERV
jgi:threonine/homoserine/homoserine lactone efflux protein